MALISCPNCGKRITDRTKVCPHCNTALIKKDDTPIVSKESVAADGKKSIFGVFIAAVEAFLFTKLLAVIFGALCNVYMGETGKRAFIEGSRAFRSNSILILAVGLAALCVCPLILEKITKMRAEALILAVSIVLALAFGIPYLSRATAFQLLASAKDANGCSIVEAEVMSYARYVPFFYAAALPLYQGMFCLLSQRTAGKKGILQQAVFALIALVLTLILSFIALSVLCMGTAGTAFAGVSSALIILFFAALRKK